MSVPTATASLDDSQAIAAEQRRELMSVLALDFDLDFAFNLQLQEAISASLTLDQQPSAVDVSQLSRPKDDEHSKFTDLLRDDVLKLEQQLKDQAISEIEFRNFKDDLHRRIHDHRVALEISKMPEDEWEDYGDEFERPFGEGTSKGVNEELFRVYCKGLVGFEHPKGIPLGGIGVAICNSNDDLLFELRKPSVGNGMGRNIIEVQALIEALNAALELDLERVIFYCDYYPIYKFCLS
ncbi:hypothetical protein OROHE_014080 [Orobanche hederae]